MPSNTKFRVDYAHLDYLGKEREKRLACVQWLAGHEIRIAMGHKSFEDQLIQGLFPELRGKGEEPLDGGVRMEMQCVIQGPIRPRNQRNPGQRQRGDGSVAAVQRSWNLDAG